jgi:virginiamycin B lyase
MRRAATVALLAVVVAACGGAGPTPPSGSAAVTSPAASAPAGSVSADAFEIVEFDVPAGSHPHDVAPGPDGVIWYTGQRVGTLGILDPESGDVREVPLGSGSAPHGVIAGPDGGAWITDGGLNAIVRVDPADDEVRVFPLPDAFPNANLNTAVFDGDGVLWFTGQSGMYGRLDPSSGTVEGWQAPEGRGPYGIATTPDGEVWYVSLAGSHLARIHRETGEATVFEPPTRDQGARRVWADSAGRLFVAEWNASQVGMYDPATDRWQEWRLPGEQVPQAYAVYVDDQDIVWLTDFGNNAIVRFDPTTEAFTPLALPTPDAAVRQLLGRPGEVWGAESATDQLVLVRTT